MGESSGLLPASAQRFLQGLRPGLRVGSVEPLQGAWTSRQSWRVQHDAGTWVLKPARPGPTGLARAQHEFAATRWAFAHGLAPEPLGFAADSGWLAHAYVPGNTPWEDCPGLTPRLEALHAAAPPAWPRFDPLQVAQASVAALSGVHALTAAQHGWFEQRLAAAQAALKRAGPGALAPCHNDVQPFNLVPGTPPLLIDWEDAALGDPLWDVASWIVSLELPADRRAGFLSRPTARDLARLEAWCVVAQVYFLAWGLLRPGWRELELARLQQLMR